MSSDSVVYTCQSLGSLSHTILVVGQLLLQYLCWYVLHDQCFITCTRSCTYYIMVIMTSLAISTRFLYFDDSGWKIASFYDGCQGNPVYDYDVSLPFPVQDWQTLRKKCSKYHTQKINQSKARFLVGKKNQSIFNQMRKYPRSRSTLSHQ